MSLDIKRGWVDDHGVFVCVGVLLELIYGMVGKEDGLC